MTVNEALKACDILDNQYRNMEKDKALQQAYYEGMKDMVKMLILGTGETLVRDNEGLHRIDID